VIKSIILGFGIFTFLNWSIFHWLSSKEESPKEDTEEEDVLFLYPWEYLQNWDPPDTFHYSIPPPVPPPSPWEDPAFYPWVDIGDPSIKGWGSSSSSSEEPE